MFQKFFTNTITSKFIKNLLNNTNLPTIRTVRDGDLIIKGCSYIYQNMIIECTQTGRIFGPTSQYLTTLEDLLANNELITGTGETPGEYRVVDMYVFGNEYKGLTYKYQSHFDFYDSETHYQLGKYLRCIRDLCGVNLMPFYNCFNYKVVSGFYLDKKSKYGYVEKSSDKYDLYAVPVKFNRAYTVAFSCKFNAALKSVICNNTGLVRANYQGVNTILTDLIDEKVVSITNSIFNQPFTYKIKTTDRYLMSFENSLYLIIQLPKNTKTSIVVLEGDYTQNANTRIFDVSQLAYDTPNEKDLLFTKNLSLLQFNDENIYAFSDKLIEYLTSSVISRLDTITQNIQRVQNDVRSQFVSAENVNYYNKSIVDGEWNDYLRSLIYASYVNNRNKVQFDVFDIDGYVDKRVEEFITRGYGE